MNSTPDPISSTSSSTVSSKAYSWLLGISLILTAVFCWLYVTKPVQIINMKNVTSPLQPSAQASSQPESEDRKQLPNPSSSLIPSDDVLPGVKQNDPKAQTQSAKGAPSKIIDPRQLLSSDDGSGWETTNARVQHILSADTGTGEQSKIVLNVPVLYQTRTMRWTPPDVQKARDILTRLMVYEGNLSKVKQEGKFLLAEWNQLLEKTVPSRSLRADSPSLPYNHGNQSQGQEFPGSGNSIQVEQ